MKKILLSLLLLASCSWAADPTTRIGLAKPDFQSTRWDVPILANYDIIDSSVALQASSNTFTANQYYSAGITMYSENSITFKSGDNIGASSIVNPTSGSNALEILALAGVGINRIPGSIAALEVSPATGLVQSFGNFALISSSADASTAYSGFSATGPISQSVLWTLPKRDGTSNQVLSTDGSSHLSFITPPGSSGASALQVTASGVQITSPTASMNFSSQTFTLGATGSTATIALNGSSVTLQGQNVIKLGASLQTGATFYVSSGAVSGQITANKVVASTLSISGNSVLGGNLQVGGVNGLTVTNLASGKCVQTTTGGQLTVASGACQSGSGVPGGNDTAIQFNNSGDFGGDETILSWDGAVLNASGTIKTAMILPLNAGINGENITLFNDGTGSNGSYINVSGDGSVNMQGTTIQLNGVVHTNGTELVQTALRVGNPIASADPSAVMEAMSGTQGFLPPRMSTTQRDAILSPAEGLVVYSTTTHLPYFYNGTSWSGYSPVIYDALANALFGTGAGGSLSGGGVNVLLGRNAGGSLIAGSNNVHVGDQAGLNELGSGTVYLGNGTGPASNLTLSNATAIGSLATVSSSNTMVLGAVGTVAAQRVVMSTFTVSSGTVTGKLTIAHPTRDGIPYLNLNINDFALNAGDKLIQFSQLGSSVAAIGYTDSFSGSGGGGLLFYNTLGTEFSRFDQTNGRFSIGAAIPNGINTINTSGNVGIGAGVLASAAPTNGLLVQGNTVHQGTVTFSGNVGISSGVLVNGSAGTNGQVLTSGGAGTVPTWSTASGGGSGIVSPGTFTWTNTLGLSVSTISVGGTSPILSTGTLQTGSTFYVSSGTVSGQLSAASLSLTDGSFSVAVGGLTRTTGIINNGGLVIGSSLWNNGFLNTGYSSYYFQVGSDVFVPSPGASTFVTSNNRNIFNSATSGISGWWDTRTTYAANGAGVSVGSDFQLVGLNLQNTFGETTNLTYNSTSPISGIQIKPTISLNTASTGTYTAVNINVLESSLGTNTTNYLIDAAVNNLRKFAVSSWGHVVSTGTAPTLSSCGSGPSIVGTDFAGTVTAGSTSAGCTLTFAKAYKSDPSCVVTPQTGSVVNTFTYSHSTTGIVVTETAFGTGKFDYHCVGMQE